jgi:hypothetical protein
MVKITTIKSLRYSSLEFFSLLSKTKYLKEEVKGTVTFPLASVPCFQTMNAYLIKHPVNAGFFGKVLA